ncbi:MAG: class I SAM-dependent methyltransferase [Armatimonadota bacterium]
MPDRIPVVPHSAHGYGFLNYVSRKRMLTFWYQLAEIMQLDVNSVLEIGLGPRVVTGVLKELGKQVKTADIDPALNPDYLVPVQRLTSVIPPDSFDLLLCARVLHHVPLDELDTALEEMSKVSRRYVLLTVPVDELRFYLGASATARPQRWLSFRVPLSLKRLALRAMRRDASRYAQTWKLGCCPGSTLQAFEDRLSKLFTIEKSYAMPEVRNHRLFLLSKL